MGWLDGKQIVDALYGNSYDPLIQKIYKGDELIFERNSWDYILEDTDISITSQDQLIRPGINPLSEENIGRNFEVVFKGSTSQTGENGTVIGFLSRLSGSGSGPYNFEVSLNKNGFLTIWQYGMIDDTYTHDSTGNNKEIKCVKRIDSLTGEYQFKFYVDGTEISTRNYHIISSATGGTRQELVVGGCKMGGFYGFTGHLDYFKFRFTS